MKTKMLGRIIGLICLSAFIFTALGTATHTVVLTSYSYASGNTILNYTVTSGTQPALSHWSFELCTDIYDADMISVSGGEIGRASCRERVYCEV